MDSKELITMRCMEWEKAKGHLLAALCTFWNDGVGYSRAKDVVEIIIKQVEEEGIFE